MHILIAYNFMNKEKFIIRKLYKDNKNNSLNKIIQENY